MRASPDDSYRSASRFRLRERASAGRRSSTNICAALLRAALLRADLFQAVPCCVELPAYYGAGEPL